MRWFTASTTSGKAIRPVVAAPGDEADVHLQPDELGSDRRVALPALVPPAILDRDGTTFDPSELSQSLDERGGPRMVGCRRTGPHEPDGGQLRLRARRQRPCRRRTAEQPN